MGYGNLFHCAGSWFEVASWGIGLKGNRSGGHKILSLARMLSRLELICCILDVFMDAAFRFLGGGSVPQNVPRHGKSHP
jgi:hypothetical protein